MKLAWFLAVAELMVLGAMCFRQGRERREGDRAAQEAYAKKLAFERAQREAVGMDGWEPVCCHEKLFGGDAGLEWRN